MKIKKIKSRKRRLYRNILVKYYVNLVYFIVCFTFNFDLKLN